MGCQLVYEIISKAYPIQPTLSITTYYHEQRDRHIKVVRKDEIPSDIHRVLGLFKEVN